MAIPRISPRGGAIASLPQPLAPSDVARLHHILNLQAHGDLEAASREALALPDTTLLGHVLADRYLGRFHQATVAELADWLARYGDEAEAPAIHALLVRKLPRGQTPPPAPPAQLLADDKGGGQVPEEMDKDHGQIARNPVLDRTVLARAAAGNDRSALRLIATTKGLSVPYVALLRGEVAQAMFLQNRDEDALEIAARTVRVTPIEQQAGVASYIAGLASWRLGYPASARSYFEGAWRAKAASPAIRAAGAFWAARAHLQNHNPAGYATWLRRAAEGERTFYGLIARRSLGISPGLSWESETLGEADAEAILGMPGGRRALALLQIGEPDLAEAELRRLWPAVKDSPPLVHALLLVAAQAGLTDLAAQVAELAQAADGRSRDNLRFPIPKLRPRGGFRIDPALVYGLTRVESNFDSSAVSAAGARGLMQLMPVTAGYVTKDKSMASGSRLHDPALNLDVGQQYVSHLADLDVIEGDLIRLLCSYNSGPGNFARWGAAIRDGGDPLMFIESIPVTETRNFVQHVLTYTWIYAARLRLPSPSLDEIAAGVWPRLTGSEAANPRGAVAVSLN